MEARDSSYYDLVARVLNGGDFQGYIDTVFAEKYNTPDTPGFDWEPDMQDDFDIRSIHAKVQVYTMAAYTDLDSPGPVKSTQEFELGHGKIPRMKHRFNMNEAKIRKHMLAMQRFGSFDDAMASSIENILFESSDILIGGNHNRLKWQRHQAVSTGKFGIIAENNPGGLSSGLDIDFNIPEENRWTSVWWDSAGKEKTGIDPIKELKDKVKVIRQQRYGIIDHVEVNKNTWDNFIELSAVRKSLGYMYNPLVNTEASALQQGKVLDDDVIKKMLERKLNCPIMLIDSVSAVEKYNDKKGKIEYTQLQSFKENVFVFVPSAVIGSIHAVRPLVIGDGARTALFDGGRTVITQTFDAKNKTQEIASELTALCVPTVTPQMYYLTVK